MKVLRKVLRVVGWTLGMGAVLIIGIFVTALVINRDDRPASSEARAMAATLDTLPEVADEDNAYVYMLGFAAARGADPWQIGMERANWIRRLRSDYTLSRDSDPYPKSLHDVWHPEEKAFFDDCPVPAQQRQCFALMSEAGAELDEWLGRQDWVLARYETLLSYTSWRGIHTGDPRTPSATLSNVIEARRAGLLEAWNRANHGDAAGVRAVLGKDLEFWRLVLAESDSLLTKMVAASLLENHFEQSNLILRRLPADRVSQAVPAAWREPISAAERSLHRPFAFELRYVRNVLESRWSETDRLAAWTGIERHPPGLLQRLDRNAAGALFQMQDSLNHLAHAFSLVADALDEPYGQIPDALGRGQNPDIQGAGGWFEVLYNFTGDRVAGAGGYGDYAARTSDLEGVRRAALLASELRSRGVAPSEIEAALAKAILKNPYTNAPFTWDSESGAIVFDGLAGRNGGRHVFWY